MGSKIHTNLIYRNKVTLFSTLLAIGIVIRHSVNIIQYNISDGWLYWFEKSISQITDIIVPCFFVLSGYLFFQNYDTGKLLLKWKSRIWSLVIPYFVWNIVAYLFYQLIAINPLVLSHMNMEIEPFNLEWLLRNMVFGYHNITWFIRNLIIYVFIFPILYPFFKTKKNYCILFLVILYLISIVVPSGYIKYSVFFGVGMFIGIFYKSFPLRKTKNYILPLFIVLLTVTFDTFIGIPEGIYIPIRIIQVFLFWMLADGLAVDIDIKWWMRLSFFIYLTHSMILESVEKIILIIFGRSIWGAVIDLALAPALTLMLIWVCAQVLRRTGMIWVILNGGRK